MDTYFDIDFSVPLFEIERWQQKNFIKGHKFVYFGSRAHQNQKLSQILSKIYWRIFKNFHLYIFRYKYKRYTMWF